MYPWVTSSPQDVRSWLLALFAFVLMFPMFMRIPVKMSKWLRGGIQLSAYTLGIVMLLTVNYAMVENLVCHIVILLFWFWQICPFSVRWHTCLLQKINGLE